MGNEAEDGSTSEDSCEAVRTARTPLLKRGARAPPLRGQRAADASSDADAFPLNASNQPKNPLREENLKVGVGWHNLRHSTDVAADERHK